MSHMSSASGQIRLRLVGDPAEMGGAEVGGAAGGERRAMSEAERRARAAIARENRSAAGLSATDARWVVATRAAEALEGGRLGILRPERRRHIAALATRLGLRPFDANLIMAIVQDSARSGAAGGALGVETADRLRLVREAEAAEEKESHRAWRLLLLAALLGVVLASIAVQWVVG